MKREEKLPVEMGRVAERIARWRAERTRLGPMPQELWRAAVELAGDHGVSATARGLNVDFGALKKRVDRDREQKRGRGRCALEPSSYGHEAGTSEAVHFIELDGSALVTEPSPARGTSVELSRPDGATMTVRLGGEAAVDVGALVESFLRSVR